MTQKTSPLLPLIEALAFAAFAGWFIWRLQEASRYAWMAFPIWLMASFAANQDTPRSLGWRADNLWNATKRSSLILLPCAIAIAVTGLFLGGRHSLPHLHSFLFGATNRLKFSRHQSFARRRIEPRYGFSYRRRALCLAPLAQSRPRPAHSDWRRLNGMVVR